LSLEEKGRQSGAAQPWCQWGGVHFMSDSHLATYLNDHLAGSEVALELLEHLQRLVPGAPAGQFAAELQAEFAADRQELEALMARLQIAQSRTRKVAAWISEKLTELKLLLDDRKGGELRMLEIWDALSLGIEGKRLLWRTLASAVDGRPELSVIDLKKLEQRAEDQHRKVEVKRLEAAKAAFV
jgi:hypothetical protein